MMDPEVTMIFGTVDSSTTTGMQMIGIVGMCLFVIQADP